jgi:hypothetical protein
MDDNKYFCELCNKKVKAQKMQSIKKFRLSSLFA